MSLERDIERGRNAQAVLDSPVYAESYTLIEQELTRLWRESRDKDEREELHRLLRMLDKARNVLEATMRSGQLAADDLRKRQNLAQRIGARLRSD